MSRDYKTRKPNTSKPEKGGSAFFGGFVGYALGLVSAIGIWLYFNFGQTPFLTSDKVASSAEKGQSQLTPEVVNKPASINKAEEPPVNVVEEKPRFDFYKILPGIDEPEIDHAARATNTASEPSKAPQNIAKIPENTNKPTEIAPPVTPAPVIQSQPIVTESKPLSQSPTPPKVSSQPQSQQQPQAQPQPSVAPQVTTAAPSTKEKIFLQAGAFRRTDDAEKMKAQLALLGVFASIQPIDLAEKGMLYRVRIGPFSNRTDSDKISASLRENGIETQSVKLQ